MKSFLMVLRNTVLLEMEYRISYFILIISNLITLAMEYAVMTHIFEGRTQVGTLHKENVVPFIVLGTIIRSSSSLWSIIGDAVDTIREGSFQRFLIQPIHYPSYFFAQALGGKLITYVVLFTTAIIFKFGFGYEQFLNLQVLPQFLLALAFSAFLSWQIYLFMVYLGFWIEEASFMGMAFNISIGVFSGTLIPLDWIPSWLLKFVALTPFPLLGDFPMRAGLGTLGAGEFSQYFTQGVVWVLFLALLNAIFWRLGTKRYEAFGG